VHGHGPRVATHKNARRAADSLQPNKTSAGSFEAGLRLLQAGQLAEAGQCGRSALALGQDHAASLHLMGMLRVASKRYGPRH